MPTVGIEPLALGDRVEDPEVRLGVGADRGGPLPAAQVRRRVAVDQVAHEMRLADPPIDEQVLRQEARDDHPGAVRHEPRGEELPHRGIHDRVARSTLAPRLGDVARIGQRASGPRHAAIARLEGLGRDTRRVPQDVRIEVPPGEFRDEPLRVGAVGPRQRSGHDLERREQPESKVGTETRRGGRIGEPVSRSGIPAQAALGTARQPRRQPLARVVLAGSEQLLHVGGRRRHPEIRRLGDTIVRDAPGAAGIRRWGQLIGRVDHRTQRPRLPAPQERREDTVGRARGREDVLRVMDEQARVGLEGDARAAQARLHRAIPAPTIRRGVAADEDPRSGDLHGE